MEYETYNEIYDEMDEDMRHYNKQIKKVCPFAQYQEVDGDDSLFCEATNRLCRATSLWRYGSHADFNMLYGKCTKRGDERNETPQSQELSIDDFISKIEKNLNRDVDNIT